MYLTFWDGESPQWAFLPIVACTAAHPLSTVSLSGVILHYLERELRKIQLAVPSLFSYNWIESIDELTVLVKGWCSYCQWAPGNSSLISFLFYFIQYNLCPLVPTVRFTYVIIDQMKKHMLDRKSELWKNYLWIILDFQFPQKKNVPVWFKNIIPFLQTAPFLLELGQDMLLSKGQHCTLLLYVLQTAGWDNQTWPECWVFSSPLTVIPSSISGER